MNIVLVNPQIPQNTGNIARTCAVTGSALHLVKPLGFSLDDKYLKRAGLDYWDQLDINIHENFDRFWKKISKKRIYIFTSKSQRSYHEIQYDLDEYLIFGPEPDGMSEEFLRDNFSKCLRIPMLDEARSLNLANSVAIVIYEAFRQHNFPDFKKEGNFLKEF